MKALAIPEKVEQGLASNYHLIHNDSTGIICMSIAQNGTWKNEYGRYEAIEKKFLELENLENVFFSQNTFRKFKKGTEHLFELKALYLDLDYYRTSFSKDQILFAIECKVNEHEIPLPTQIIDSGHGLYLVWRIQRIPAMAVRLWRAMQEYLYYQLKELGADRKSLEPTRVMRFTDSINAKYPDKKIVETISTYPIAYDLHQLQYEYLKYPPKRNKYTKKRNTNVILFKKNIYTLYCSRREDILSLCKLRNYEMTGIREITLFLYRYYSCLTVTDPQVALEMMLELNNQFTEPCAYSTVKRATRSAEKAAADEKYNYYSQTLVDLLHITNEEMMMKWSNGEYILKTIITKEIKYKRRNLIRNETRRNELGNTKRKQESEDKLEVVRTLSTLGLTQKQIAEQMGIQIRTVQRYYKKLRDSSQ